MSKKFDELKRNNIFFTIQKMLNPNDEKYVEEVFLKSIKDDTPIFHSDIVVVVVRDGEKVDFHKIFQDIVRQKEEDEEDEQKTMSHPQLHECVVNYCWEHLQDKCYFYGFDKIYDGKIVITKDGKIHLDVLEILRGLEWEMMRLCLGNESCECECCTTRITKKWLKSLLTITRYRY
jgi:hypothetical protein